MQEGWIKLHRKLLYSAIIKYPKTVVLWIHLLLKANHQEKTRLINGKNITVLRGQTITGRNRLSEETGLSVAEVRTALNHLKTTNMITIRNNTEFSTITIINYNHYQSDNQSISQRTAKASPSDSQASTTNNNDNNEENDNNEKNISSAKAEDEKNITDNFIKSWSNLYESETNKKFKADKKDFVIIAKLIKQYGKEAVLEKTRFLFLSCQKKSLWFTKGGIADFSIGKLSSKWNELIESNTGGSHGAFSKSEQTRSAGEEFLASLGKK